MKYSISVSFRDGMNIEDNDFITDLKGLVDLITLYTEHTACRFISGERTVDFTFSVRCLKED